MNRKVFFDNIRRGPFNGALSPEQVAGVNAIIAGTEGWRLTWVAYALATAFAEVGRTMQPVREGYAKSDAAARAYVAKQGYDYAKPAGPYKEVYYGRGFVQLTWLRNYKKAGDKIGVDLVANPDAAMELDNAAAIMRGGMERGWFTGKKLPDYLNDSKTDYVNARRIINGTDRAAEIAGYARKFEAALREAGYGKPVKNTPMTTKSRTAQGAGAAGAGGTVVLGGAVADAADALQQADGHISAGTWIGLAVGALIIGGAAYAVYARWDDGGRWLPWQKEGD